jgi:hypothetical protein
VFTVYSQLTCLSIDNCTQSIRDLEYLFSLTPALVHLKLVSSRSTFDSIFSGSYWEQFIRIKLPELKKFDFFFTCHLETKTEGITNGFMPFIVEFQAPFWVDKQRWFVKCDYALEVSKFRLYTTPICIDNFDNQSTRWEVSLMDNMHRLTVDPTNTTFSATRFKV